VSATTPPRRRFRRALIWFVLIVIAALALYTWVTLNYRYSEGERAGLLQKFSRKGWICKTHEGELAMYVVAGVAPQIWDFSVRDDAVASQLQGLVGRRVQLSYSEHPGVPTSCFADTRYFVNKVTVIDGSAVAPVVPVAPAAPPAPGL
jgi:hypothetical protein